MQIFLFTFGVVVLVIAAMAVGVMFKRKPIQGSCGGLNAISDADHCVVCKRPHDPNSCYQRNLRKRMGVE
ncbi:(Na+)-NQR maturation NqrM [Terasakiella sp. A23]|uniref:(Na+)-NQR maturation NqrM n=1 Tax=Terasakiella sp. FCG-A23 TaxID=3080561 RepID=UPI0029534FDA|nr:(Na+)-NQR maturation NqrM [Terasakiella sp. A23]MDV7338819.1 (Na+)-NQR maturation NqrM [Terasakiella sp. A23]